ncbi:hypothetical protein BZA77DRAFT_347986 [Pyronema omphalodes]|nr:hypothetical protein BZA77DRAFT_347986 [Pyronema omphalodes]
MSSIPITIPASIRAHISTLKLRVSTFDSRGNLLFHSIDKAPVPVSSLKIRVNAYDEAGRLLLTDSVVVASEVGDPRFTGEGIDKGGNERRFGMVILNGGGEEGDGGRYRGNGGNGKQQQDEGVVEDVSDNSSTSDDTNSSDEDCDDCSFHNPNLSDEDTLMSDQAIHNSQASPYVSHPASQLQDNSPSVNSHEELEIINNLKHFHIPSQNSPGYAYPQTLSPRNPNTENPNLSSHMNDAPIPLPIPSSVSSPNELLSSLLSLQSSHLSLRNSFLSQQSLTDKKLLCITDFIDEKLSGFAAQLRKQDERCTKLFQEVGTLDMQVSELQFRDVEVRGDFEEIVGAVGCCLEGVEGFKSVKEDMEGVREKVKGMEEMVDGKGGWEMAKVMETEEMVREVAARIQGQEMELGTLKRELEGLKHGVEDEMERVPKKRRLIRD